MSGRRTAGVKRPLTDGELIDELLRRLRGARATGTLRGFLADPEVMAEVELRLSKKVDREQRADY